MFDPSAPPRGPTHVPCYRGLQRIPVWCNFENCTKTQEKHADRKGSAFQCGAGNSHSMRFSRTVDLVWATPKGKPYREQPFFDTAQDDINSILFIWKEMHL